MGQQQVRDVGVKVLCLNIYTLIEMGEQGLRAGRYR